MWIYSLKNKLFYISALFPRSEERAGQRSVVGVSKSRFALVVISLH